jgi:hypothetical protein
MALTYYATKTADTNGIHVALKERVASSSAPATSTETTGNIAGGASVLAFAYATAASNPNIANWGNGTYRADLSVASAGANCTYGVLTVGSAAGHFARVDSGLTADS